MTENVPPPMNRPVIPSENKTRIPRPMLCRVMLLNGEEFEVSIDRRSYGQLLFERVCDYVDLMERDYFGLTYKDDKDSDNSRYWLDLHKKITKQKKRGKMDFEFSLKFYPPDPTQLTESLTRYLVVLQIRRDIISGRLPCSQATHAMLGSYAVQADKGDYDPLDHGSGINYIADMPFAPDQTEELLYKISTLHRQHKGLTPEDAETRYLEYSKKIALYGIELHRAKDSDYVDIMLGVGATGISVYRDNLRINRFVWPKVLKISYRRNKFLLRIRPAEFETYESWIAFRLKDNKHAKRLWKMSVEHHAFLRLRTSEDAKKRSGFPRFGSKYRYSGRTLHETRRNASMADRPSKQFDRTASRQSLNSVLQRNRAQSKDNLNHHENYLEQRNLHNMSFDTAIDEHERNPHSRDRAPISAKERIINDGRTPLQSPLPRDESPKFSRPPVKYNGYNESDLEQDERNTSTLQDSPGSNRQISPRERRSPEESRRLSPQNRRRSSPKEERRHILNQQAQRGVPTPLAAIVHSQRDKVESDEEEDQRSYSSANSLDRRENSHIAKPAASSNSSKKPEKPPKPEKAPKPAKPPKPQKAPKPSNKKEKEPMMEVSI